MTVVVSVNFCSSASIKDSKRLSIAQVEKQRSENQVHGHNHEDRNHYGPGCGTAHLLGTPSRGQSFQASHRRDGDTEHDALDQPGKNIPQEKRFNGGLKVS